MGTPRRRKCEIKAIFLLSRETKAASEIVHLAYYSYYVSMKISLGFSMRAQPKSMPIGSKACATVTSLLPAKHPGWASATFPGQQHMMMQHFLPSSGSFIPCVVHALQWSLTFLACLGRGTVFISLWNPLSWV